MREIFFWTLIISHIALLFSSVVPSKKCHLSDKNCLKSAAQSILPTFAVGVNDIGVLPLDVMLVDTIDVNLSGLLLKMKDIKIHGYKKSIIDDISVNLNKKQIKLKFHTDIIFKGKYKASGTLLNLPITGDGDIVFTLDHFEVILTMPFDIVKDGNGEDIIELTSYKYNYDVKKDLRTELTNLFNGNKVLGDAMLKVINENWKLLLKDLGRGIMDKPLLILFTAIKTYLRSMPLKSIAEY